MLPVCAGFIVSQIERKDVLKYIFIQLESHTNKKNYIMNPAKQNFTTPIQLRDTIYAFQSSRLVLTAYELDIFTNIEEKGTTSLAVAEALKTNPRATDRLMNALCAIGLLKKKETLFFMTTFSQYYLSKKSSGYMKGFMHTINM